MSIDSVDYVPVYVWNKGSGAKNRYELLDVRAEITAYENGERKITANLYSILKSELANTEKVLRRTNYKREYNERKLFCK